MLIVGDPKDDRIIADIETKLALALDIINKKYQEISSQRWDKPIRIKTFFDDRVEYGVIMAPAIRGRIGRWDAFVDDNKPFEEVYFAHDIYEDAEELSEAMQSSEQEKLMIKSLPI